ncbi:TonB-dependent receptor [Lacimicrobium sp. SS2-24]|uniref:TonB-dependent receptor n=1 Tax=Lacimicrobium sp. SS2-24 TaxID=2005569 RepID=UPI000B4AC266|nr:TonB-dependent receptor [Lacimicrobium sp. SS2-24]
MTSTKLNKITQGLSLAMMVTATISTQNVMAQQEDSDEAKSNAVEVIQIRGLRASTKADLNNKRFADGILDSITADDIGKLPDITIADTLQRVPGIQINRSAGEGSGVNIRGVGSVGTLLNGEQFLSAGSITTLQPNFSDIPSALVSGIDVHKSPTSKILAGGISGTLDLKTIRPFSLDEGVTFASSAEVSRGNYTGETDPKVTAFVGYNTDRFAVSTSVSWDRVNLANYRLGTPNIGWSGAQTEGNAWDGIGEDRTGDGDQNDALVTFIGYGNMNRNTERERLGITSTMQAQLTNSVEMVADVFYTEMDDADRSIGLVADNAWGDFGWEQHGDDLTSRGVIADGGLAGSELYTANTGVLNAPRVASTSESRTNDRDSLNLNLEFKFDNGGPLSGSVRYIHGEGQRETTHNIAQSFLTDGASQSLFRNDGTGEIPVHPQGVSGRVPVIRDFSGEHPQLTYPSDLGQNMEDYAIISTYSEENYYEEATLDVLRADGTYRLESSDLTTVEFGVRKGRRDVKRDTYVLLAPINQDGLSTDVMWKDQGEVANDTNGDGVFSRAGGDKTIGYDNYLNFANLPSSWVIQSNDFGPADIGNFYFINPEIMDDHIGFQNTLYPGNFKQSQPGESYNVLESTKSAYFNLKFDGELGSLPYKANVGLQYIKTDLTVMQNLLGSEVVCRACPGIVDSVGQVVTDQSYSDTLPALNLRLNLTDDLVARASYGKTMNRLDTRNLGGGMNVGTTINQGEVSDVPVGERYAVEANRTGNPNLKPTRATNHDLTLEWYFSDTGLLSVAWFKMDIESNLTTDVSTEFVPDADGIVRRQVQVRGPVNGDGGTIKGYEFAYQQGFDFLPGFWSGFGAGLNYTYAPSTSDTRDFEGNKLPLNDNSENSGNAVLWYEKGPLQVRLAANYRSERFVGQSGRNFGGGGLALYAEGTTYIDMSASYDINDNISVYFSGSNLTEEFENMYYQWEDFTIAQDIYERRLTMGVRGRW